MRELIRAMLRIKVRPYYIFHCDPVIGAGHLRSQRVEGAGDHGRVTRPHERSRRPHLRRR
jgi:L-lysine 2,3-aminomutase